MGTAATDIDRKPSVGLSLAIFVLSTVLMAYLRLYLFHDRLIVLTYGLPLLICLWHQDRRLLWSMAGTFTIMATVKAFFLLPDRDPSDWPEFSQWLMQVANIVVVSTTVHMVIRLTHRLRGKNAALQAANDELAARQEEISRQNDELQTQSEELAQQNEELQQQTEELNRQNEEMQQQSEELEQQTEELQTQAEELRATNDELHQREAMLATVLSSLQDVRDEGQVMQCICQALLTLLGGAATAAAVMEQEGTELLVHTYVGPETLARQRWPFRQSFASVVMQHDCTGFVDDLALRPDLVVAQPDGRQFRSILATPLRLDGQPAGAVKVYAVEPQRWTSEQFRIIEWVAAQCSMILKISRSEHALRQRVEELKTLMDLAPVAIWVSRDPQCRQIVGNRRANALYEAEASENVSAGTVPERRRFLQDGRELTAEQLPMQAAVRENRDVAGEELEVRTPSGRRIFLLGSASPLRDEQGDVRGCLGAFMDITDRKRAEQQLKEWSETLERRVAERTAEAKKRAKQLQRLAGELTQAEQKERQRLATILHDDLQQLLVGAKFHLNILHNQTADAQVRDGLRHVDDLLDQSLTTSRSLTVELSPPILHEGTFAHVLHWLARWAKEKHALTVEVQADEQVNPQDRSVRTLLFQAIRELLLNVRKHSKVDNACIRMKRDGGQVEVIVTDKGEGFDPSAKQEHGSDGSGVGSGFGLFSIAERLELLAGRMEVSSHPGQGTRVRLMAPLEAAPEAVSSASSCVLASQPGDKQPSHVHNGQKIRVLLADDHAVVRDGLARLLGMQLDMTVVGQAEDGLEAVEMVQGLRPDVVIMDVSMPNLGGVEATRRILRDLPETRVIGLSMHAQEDVAAQMGAAGAVAYLSKTSQPPKLLAAIRECGCWQSRA